MKEQVASEGDKQSSSVGLRLAIAGLIFITTLNVFLPIYIPVPTSIPLALNALKREQSRAASGEGFPRELDLTLKQVALTVEDSVNFQLDSVEGAAQWGAIQPSGGGYITLGTDTKRRRFRLSMFHALECMDIIRQDVLRRKADRETPTTPEAHSCLDYVRQTIQCRSDMQLEQVRSEYGGKSVQPFIAHNNCRDWSKVYAEVERLHAQSELGVDQY
ncbi:hypothetical protein EW145_g6924 [Phellinidium pouzarii]|uniref:Uncharacterized protein n=1 Tax=Phellinidium pouzarii TaxID=167371 RepID=A0A4S4KS98_9AGAM|nr:hypothetical protein EW145_g6924 [Phellinidium pouzarii]